MNVCAKVRFASHRSIIRPSWPATIGPPDFDGCNMQEHGQNGILAAPLQPGACRRCPECGRWFALIRKRVETSPIAHLVRTFKCKHCGHEQEYAGRHPPGAM
jgi:hypothetical protein